MKHHPLILASTIALSLCSCGTYDTPDADTGGKANLAAFTDTHVKAAYAGKPAITFPASIAVVRVQDSGNSGSYTVVSTRELETAGDYDTLAKNPGISGVASLNRLLLTASAASSVDLREAAAKLHADALLIYTVASESHNNEIAPPLTLVTLGLAPNKTFKVTSSASAILMDVRTGYIYGTLEQGDDRSGLTSAWGSDTTIDAAQRKAERAAFEKLLVSFDPFWKRLYARYKH